MCLCGLTHRKKFILFRLTASTEAAINCPIRNSPPPCSTRSNSAMTGALGSRTFFFSCPITSARCCHCRLLEIPCLRPSHSGNAGRRGKWESSGSVIFSNIAFVQTKAGGRRLITFWPIRFAKDWLRRSPSSRMCSCPIALEPPPDASARRPYLNSY